MAGMCYSTCGAGWGVDAIRRSGGWYMLITSGRENGGGRVGMSVVVTLIRVQAVWCRAEAARLVKWNGRENRSVSVE